MEHSASGIKAEFPLWNIPPQEVMRQFVENGFKAIITCIDNSALPEAFLGKVIDREFIDNYPKNADICGENGEYHSFVFDGPIFKKPVEFHMKQKYHREYDREFIDNYPKNADICGENGEYHSFVFDGPIFKKPVEFHMKQKYHREYHQPETNQIHRYSYLELE